METIYKDGQINQISDRLNVPKCTVANILNSYIAYLKDKLDNGETIKFLNICYLRSSKEKEDMLYETLAYTAHELGLSLNISPILVQRVFQEYEEMLIRDLRDLYAYSIRGLLRIRLEKDYNGCYRVRAKKSTVYNGLDVYVSTTGYFKRKVEVVV